MTIDADAKSRQISEAAEAYTAGAWRFSWPIFALTVGVSAWIGALTVITLRVVQAGRAGLYADATCRLLVLGLLALEFGGAAGMLLLFRRWHARWRAAHTEVVPVTSKERYPWLRGAAGVAVLPLWFFLFGRLFRESSVSLQPLLWAALMTAIVGLDMVTDLLRRATPAWKRCPTGLFVIGAYVLYAVAVALGAPQPWQHVPGAVGHLLRIGVMQLVVAVLVVVLGELHSRRQLRRLQQLVNEVPPADSHGTD